MENENNKHFPFGRKSAEGFCPPIDHSYPPNDLPPPLRGDAPMSMRPHDAGPRMPVKHEPSSRRPVGEPTPITPPHNPAPHPPTPAAQVQERNTYGLSRVPRR